MRYHEAVVTLVVTVESGDFIGLTSGAAWRMMKRKQYMGERRAHTIVRVLNKVGKLLEVWSGLVGNMKRH